MNAMNFDSSLLEQLRAECDLHALDLTRARIKHYGAGHMVGDTPSPYSVEFDAPLIDLTGFLDGAPSQLTARNADQAEGLMLLWLKRIQTAERRCVRNGMVCGWGTEKINREPLSADELDRYRSRIKERELQARMTRELTAAVEAAAEKTRAKEAHAALESRYGSATVVQRTDPPARKQRTKVPTGDHANEVMK